MTNASRNRRLNLVTESDLFKLAACNLPRHQLLTAMPVSLQHESTELNRMRCHYVKLLLQVWRAYCRHVFGTQCPFIGALTSEGELRPSSELAELVEVKYEESEKELPALNIAAIASDIKLSESVVQNCLKLVLATCRSVLTKRRFNKIKLQMGSSQWLII